MIRVTRIAAITKPPTDAIPAPTRPPIRACVELLGSPKNQVMRFHAMAPSRAAMTTTIPALKERVLAIVLATLEWSTRTVTRAPRRLKTDDSATAWVALSARVEIEVAIALA